MESDFTVYKIRFLNKKSTIKGDEMLPPTLFVIVFIGDKPQDKSLYFSPDELTKIKKDQTKIYYSNLKIYIDDTVEIIKLKISDVIVEQVNNSELTAGLNQDLNELYLFAYADEMVYVETLKQMIKYDIPDYKNNIPYEYAVALLSNFDITISDSETMHLDEIISVIFSKESVKKRCRIAKQVGQREYFIKININNIGIVNPFFKYGSSSGISNLLERNHNMLFETFSDEHKITQDTIYCGFSPFVNMSEITQSWYFPVEPKYDISLMRESIKQTNQLIEIYEKNKHKHTMISGIKNFNITIHSVKDVKFPLFILFKLLQTSEAIPLIKYRPRKKIKTSYKLYSNTETASNEKIPLLKKSIINIFVNEQSADFNYLTIYTHRLKYKEKYYYIACKFYSDGSVSIYSIYVLDESIQIEDLQKIIELALFPLTEKITKIVKTFYAIYFNNIYDTNVTINNLLYSINYEKKNEKHLIKYTNIISKKDGQLMYVKVSGTEKFPIIFKNNYMMIDKINNLYYLNIMFIYFNSIQFDTNNNVDTNKNKIILDNNIDDDKASENNSKNADSDADSDADSELKGGRTNVSKKNIFATKIHKLVPDIFASTVKYPKLKSYARTCQLNEPLVFTQEEKDKWLKSGKISDEDEFIKYNDKIDFTCPAYYCTKDGNEGPITASEIQEGKCGNVRDVTKAIFTNDDIGKYAISGKPLPLVYAPYGGISLKPGFNKNVLKNGAKSPCCFLKKKNVEIQADENNEAEYILGPNQRAPIPFNRLANIPDIVQVFLDNEKKSTEYTLLRQGVENSFNKSFVAAISSILFYRKDIKEIMTVNELCLYLSAKITMDDFLSVQNGDLFSIFNNINNSNNNSNNNINSNNINNINNIDDYHSTILDKIKKRTPMNSLFIKQLIISFENFKAYLIDSNSYIDYTYLWDILCRPNNNFFKNGINLCIFKTNKENTEIELVCPTNNSLFDAKKPICFIIQSYNHYFEPIYIHERQKKAIIIRYLYKYKIDKIQFLETTTQNIIIPTFNEMCVEKRDEKNIQELLLVLSNYLIDCLVMNFIGHVVGVVASINNNVNKFFIPCYPSGYIENNIKKIIFIDELPQNDYGYTNSFYLKLKDIMDLDIVTVVSHEKMMGLYIYNYKWFVPYKHEVNYTDTNVVSPFKIEKKPNLVEIYYANMKTQLITNDDEKYANNVKLETIFYNLFKNTMRSLILKSNMYDVLYEKTSNNFSVLSPLVQLDQIRNLLMTVGGTSIIFTDIGKNINANEIMGLEEPFFPKKNLLSKEDNKNIYYTKLADELIRFKQIRESFFNKKQFMLFRVLENDLRENEILILQTQLQNKYKSQDGENKDNEEEDEEKGEEYETEGERNNRNINPYIIKTTNKNAINFPHSDVSYENFIDTKNKKSKCTLEIQQITSKYVLKYLGTDNYERFYKNAPSCGLEIIVDLIKQYHHEDVDEKDVRNRLANLYTTMLIKGGKNKMLSILKMEKQSNAIIDAIKKEANIKDKIMSDSFYPVLLDLWLLLSHYKIPSILISTLEIGVSKLMVSKDEKLKVSINTHMLITYEDETDKIEDKKHIYINVPSMLRNLVQSPEYRQIVKNNVGTPTQQDILYKKNKNEASPPPFIKINAFLLE